MGLMLCLVLCIVCCVCSCDVVVTSGGVSMGDADLLKPALQALGTVRLPSHNTQMCIDAYR